MSTSSPQPDAGPPTSSTLLERLRAWDDSRAWNRFFEQYNPMLEKWSRSRLRSGDDVREVNQRVLWELAWRLVDFQYDSSKSFRGWLRTLHSSRLFDFLKSERRRQIRQREVAERRGSMTADVPGGVGGTTTSGERIDERRQAMHSLARQIQRRVQDRVSEKTWAVFSEIAVEGHPIAEVAARHSMRYASAFAAFSRVQKMLQQEASREAPQ